MKIRFNKNLIKDYSWIPFLNPVLWQPKDQSSSKIWVYDNQQVKKWEEIWKDILTSTNIENCDFWVYPKNFRIDFYNELKKENDFCKKHNKRLIVFYDDDNEFPINLDNCIVFRNSISKKNPDNEYCMPAFIPPLKECNKSKQAKEISIWYVWYLKAPSINLNKRKNYSRIRNILYKWLTYTKITNLISDKICVEPQHKRNTLWYLLLQKWVWITIRSKIIKEISKYSHFKTNFIKRKNKLDPSITGIRRKEYIDNISQNTFSLVMRWDWNFSYRLYEIMSIWNIPIFIDTDCRMPLENKINYKDLFVRCPINDVKNIDIYITNFLQSHERLEEVKQNILKTYNEYLTFDSRCKKICELLMNKTS